MEHSEARILATMLDDTRHITHTLFKGFDESMLHRRFEVEGNSLNSAFWIMGHLASSQNWLVLRGSSGPFRKFSWAKQFNLGSRHPDPSDLPPLDEVRSTFDAVHRDVLEHVASLDEAALAAPHQAVLRLPSGDSVRSVIGHAMRHEAMHAGQLSWLRKLNGLPTI